MACCLMGSQISCGTSRRDANPRCVSLDEIWLGLAGFDELIGVRNPRPLDQLLVQRFTDAELAHRARCGHSTRRRESTEDRQFYEKWRLERLRAMCEFSTRSPQHEPAGRMDEAAFGKREAVLAKSAGAKAGRLKQAAEMTRFVDLSERLSARPKAQDRVVPVLLFAQRCNPFAPYGKFVVAATVMFAACGFPSISRIRIEMIRIDRASINGDS